MKMQAMPTKGYNFQEGESCLNFKTSQKQLAVITEMVKNPWVKHSFQCNR